MPPEATQSKNLIHPTVYVFVFWKTKYVFGKKRTILLNELKIQKYEKLELFFKQWKILVFVHYICNCSLKKTKNHRANHYTPLYVYCTYSCSICALYHIIFLNHYANNLPLTLRLYSGLYGCHEFSFRIIKGSSFGLLSWFKGYTYVLVKLL